MNEVLLMGRTTKAMELRYGNSGKAYCNFTLAVNRQYKKDAEQKADFIPCTAFEKTAEFLAKYMEVKGTQLIAIGRMQIDTKDNEDGSKSYFTKVLVNKVEFVGSKQQSTASTASTAPPLEPITDADINEELPF